MVRVWGEGIVCTYMGMKIVEILIVCLLGLRKNVDIFLFMVFRRLRLNSINFLCDMMNFFEGFRRDRRYVGLK